MIGTSIRLVKGRTGRTSLAAAGGPGRFQEVGPSRPGVRREEPLVSVVYVACAKPGMMKMEASSGRSWN
jgi:hypothetical protein